MNLFGVFLTSPTFFCFSIVSKSFLAFSILFCTFFHVPAFGRVVPDVSCAISPRLRFVELVELETVVVVFVGVATPAFLTALAASFALLVISCKDCLTRDNCSSNVPFAELNMFTTDTAALSASS